MESYSIFSLGDQAVSLSLGNEIQPEGHQKIISMKHWLEAQAFPGIKDIVVAYSSLTIVYDLYQIRKKLSVENVYETVSQLMQKAYQQSQPVAQAQRAIKKIPVCYEEPYALDLAYVASVKNITREKIIELHTSRVYQVYMIGFLPGFPYMASLDEQLIVPRKTKPSAQVEAGSVGVAGIQTGIYPFQSPGGWQIIGRTPVSLFNPANEPPAALEPGDNVQFYAITSEQFKQADQENT
ncbi:MAG: 5-oxoprolinase subunit PxpB [Bacteroidota bacterium]